MTAPLPEPPNPSQVAQQQSILRQKPALIALSWLAIVLIGVAGASLFAPDGPNVQHLDLRNALPSFAFPLGTDDLGRSILVRIIWGGQVTLGGVAIGTFVAMFIGAPMGMIAGFLGGWWDRTLSFISDLLMAVPFLLIVLVAFSIYPNNNLVSMTIFGLFTSAPIFRIVRGATLTLTNEMYVVAARSAGLTQSQIVRRHIAPRLTGLIAVQTSIVAALALATQVGLGFLGLDVAPPEPSWGNIIADGTRNLFASMWPLIPPTLVVVFTILAFGVLGDLNQEKISARSAFTLTKNRNGKKSLTIDSTSGKLLSVRDLTVTVTDENGKTLVLVENVSFDLVPGEVLGLVGESGAGKSVTARALLGINGNVNTFGEAFFGGRDIISADERTLGSIRGKEIGFIGQDPMSSLDPLFKVENQLVEAIRTHQNINRSEAKKLALELLKDVSIKDPVSVSKKYPFELSGGLAQRVSIALALAGNPRLLIADEPTTALDVTVQMEVLGLLQKLSQERSLAIILVTHDWGVVADICDRAITMYAGEVVESGSVEEIFNNPLHPYTVALRKSDPHLQNVGQKLVPIPGSVPPPGSWPKGCRFANRCDFATPVCTASHPELELEGTERVIRCVRFAEISSGGS